MILILSQEFDVSTLNIIEWLEYYKVKYWFISDNDKISIEQIGITQNEITFNILINGTNKLNINEIKSYWYRRSNFNFEHFIEEIIIPRKFERIRGQIEKYLKEECIVLKEYLHYQLSKKNNINNFYDGRVNKLIVLEKATKHGLLIPNTHISSNLVFSSFNNKEEIISKSISESISIRDENIYLQSYTTTIENKNIFSKSEYFTMLFQNKIFKLFEIRTFYLKGKFYSMAIFSQQNNDTKVDFRNYSEDKPNRNVPFDLPIEIEKKLDILLIDLKLNCCSIDMIYTQNNQYIFLEINPVGQFGMISEMCNQNLHYIIAKNILNG
jgi:ATP-GRASP peptide maturase of grasp-with-spasm system